jgi:hypothetical protein
MHLGFQRSRPNSSRFVEAFAKRAGFEIVAEFYDQAVSGADPIDARSSFAAMLEHIAGNGARTIIVGDARDESQRRSTGRPFDESDSKPALGIYPTQFRSSSQLLRLRFDVPRRPSDNRGVSRELCRPRTDH